MKFIVIGQSINQNTMNSKVFSCNLFGLDGQIVEVQADVGSGMPSFNIVGLGDTSVQESRERVKSSIKNSGFQFPQSRKTINLAPAQLKKQGSLFDLPIAISILLASEQVKSAKIEDAIIVGELSLNGEINGINGALAITQCAKEKGFKKIFLPKENATEASFVPGIEITPFQNLKDLADHANGTKIIAPFSGNNFERVFSEINSAPPKFFSNIVGLEKEKRVLQIAAAGGHNLLLIGPPGTGKTLLARSFINLLPPMNPTEVLETTKIFSVAGLVDNHAPLITKRPLREVHHSASLVSVIGGGNVPKPGEISFAHNGVLFFDEIVEFPRHVLESLRQPLEDKYININRIYGSIKFPSNFIFIATMNPCPCGHRGDGKLPCICTDVQVKNYRKKLSGPILDRFDIIIEVPRVILKDIFTIEAEQQNHEIYAKIIMASQIQKNRFKDVVGIFKNSDMNLDEVRKHCYLGKLEKLVLEQAVKNLSLSNRAYFKIIKLARTIADLQGSENITTQHLKEAIQYRINGTN